MSDGTVVIETSLDKILTDDGMKKVDSLKAVALVGLAAVGGYVVAKKVAHTAITNWQLRKEIKQLRKNAQ